MCNKKWIEYTVIYISRLQQPIRRGKANIELVVVLLSVLAIHIEVYDINTITAAINTAITT